MKNLSLEEMNKEFFELKAKEEIRQQIYKYCHCVDRCATEVGYDVFHKDAIIDYGKWFKGTGKEFIDWVCDSHKLFNTRSTMHRVSNIYVKVDGERAMSQSYVRAVIHKYPDPDGMARNYETLSRYLDKWKYDDGKWWLVGRETTEDVCIHYYCIGKDPFGNSHRDDETSREGIHDEYKNDPAYDFFNDNVEFNW